MAKKVAWTESAWSDLHEVAEYIAKDSPNYAAAFVQEMKNASTTLKTLAKRGRCAGIWKYEHTGITNQKL